MVDPRRVLACSAVAAVSLFAISAGMGWYAQQQYDEQVGIEQRLLRAESDARSALRRARDSMDLSKRVEARFNDLQDAGIFEPVEKPRSIDRAEAILRPHFDDIARYQIGGSHEVVPSPLAAAAKYGIDVERVSIEFEPLHEDRFLDVWEAIAALRGPVGGVENCQLQRPQDTAPQAAGVHMRQAPLKAHCLLTWYRFQPAVHVDNGVPVPPDPTQGKSS